MDVGRHTIDRTIVEIETVDGVVGLGEARGLWPAAIVTDRFAPRLVGLSARDREGARAACIDRSFDHGFPERLVDRAVFSAVEIALWDIAGKAEGMPVHRLLGGPVRACAAFAAYGYPPNPKLEISEADTPAFMAQAAAEAVARTNTNLYEFKIARRSLACDIATVQAVREALGPGIDIAVDANMGWSFEKARRFLEETRDAGLANVEEPVPTLQETAALRRAANVSMSTHCTLLDAVAAYPEIDAVVFDLHAMGGLEASMRFAETVAALGRQVWLRSVWELGIGVAAMTQLALACSDLKRASQCLIDFAINDLVLPCETGTDRPGLGVELNKEALRHYNVRDL